MLARDSGKVSRLIRTSQRLLDKRRDYYEQLERAQHGELDRTAWVVWFVEQVRVSCEEASQELTVPAGNPEFALARNYRNDAQRRAALHVQRGRRRVARARDARRADSLLYAAKFAGRNRVKAPVEEVVA